MCEQRYLICIIQGHSFRLHPSDPLFCIVEKYLRVEGGDAVSTIDVALLLIASESSAPRARRKGAYSCL